MKAVQSILKVSLCILVLLVVSNTIVAQDAVKDREASSIQDKLDNKKFVFVAQSVIPQRGGTRQLTSTYDLRVTNDSLVSNLPYFGRAYYAPIDPSSAGLFFVSTSFDYTVKPGKKNSWNVLIKPKDKNDIQQLSLNVFSNGSAYLQVTSTNRQPISFNGSVR